MEHGKQSQESPVPQVVQEYVVRIPKDKHKHFNVMRFNHSLKVDVTKWKQVKMERENNYKEFKLDDDNPKYGAGSEFGRDLKEEARRKKHGIIVKQYNPEDQPWLLKVGGKGGKKFKGIREGGVTENASYYVFTQAADGTFEAHPVEQWYNFTPIQCFKALSAEEAEEEFGRRDKVLNYFSIMVKKRLQAEAGEDDDEEGKKQGSKKKKKPRKEFKITDMDEWTHDLDDSGESGNEDDEEDESSSKKAPKKGGKKKKKENKSDDEAVEESDEGDFDDKEVDYITSSSGSEEEIEEDEKANRDLKGVEDEEALRKLMSDEEEEEDEDENKDMEENPDAKEKASEQKTKQKQKKSDSSGESSSDSSDSDFDDPKFTSAIFVPNFQKSKKKSGSDNSAGSSRANTPTKFLGDKEGQKSGQKRKYPDLSSSSAKKQKIENSVSGPSSSSSSSSSTLDGITEETVRRYLQRKPITASELLHKFKSKKTKMNSDQLVNKLTDVLKKIPLQKTNIKGKMYLSLKTT